MSIFTDFRNRLRAYMNIADQVEIEHPFWTTKQQKAEYNKRCRAWDADHEMFRGGK